MSKKTAWGDYDPSDYEPHLTDYAEEIEPPDWEVENATDELEKQVKPILRNLSKFFKKMGFRVDVNEYEPPTYGGYHDNITTVVYEIDLVVKGGQKLVLDRKQWVSDGNYKPNMIIAFHSEEADEQEEGEPYEVQIDVDDFERHPTYYTMPKGDFSYFEFIDGEVPRKLLNEEFYNPRRDLEKALRSWVMWFTYQNGQMRSKWKKKRAMIERVANRYQKESMEKIDGNFKKVSPLIGTWFEGLITKLSSIENSLGYAEKIATKEHKRLEKLVKQKYGYSDNFQDDDYDDPLVQAFLWIDDFWGQVWTGKTRSMNVFQRKVEEAKDALRQTIYEINSWGDVERRMASKDKR